MNIIFNLNFFLKLLLLSSIVLFVSFRVISLIIKISVKKSLFDLPVELRKLQNNNTSNLGGFGIFFTFIFFTLLILHLNLTLLFASIIIVFLIGLKDDLVGMSPFKKLLGELMASFILIILGDVRITDFHGFMGINDISYFTSIIFSTLFSLTVINAYNLIDGVDGLSGSLGILGLFVFSCMFISFEDFNNFWITIIYIFSLLGFYIFNFYPAKIYMGDSGSLVLGLIIYYFSILTLRNYGTDSNIISYNSVLTIVFSVIVLPLFDLVRLFMTRILSGGSPFKADRNHLHHKLLIIFPKHSYVSFLICGFNVIIISISFLFYSLPNSIVIICQCIFLVLIVSLVEFFLKKINNASTI